MLLQDETVWLTQKGMQELFEKAKSTISEHNSNVFEDGELDEEVVVRDFRTTSQYGAIKGKTQENTVKNMIANTPKPPYYAVIFTSVRTDIINGYTEMSELMLELAQQQEGFLGVESARNELGITVSYWKDLESIRKWKQQSDHLIAQEKGRKQWYESYKTRIAKVERDYDFKK